MMPKPYSLSLYSPAVNAAQIFQQSLTSRARGWKRSHRKNGGCYLGSFTMEGTTAELGKLFEGWMGYEVRERAAGMLSWSGLIYEMDLTVNGITRHRSFDLMANAVRTSYTKETYTGDNLVKEPSLELAGVGGADLFAAWYENTGTAGVVTRMGPGGAADGNYYVRLTADTDDDPEGFTYLRQNIQLTAGARYKLTYYTKGDGTYAGRVGVNDPNIGSGVADWVVYPHSTGVTANAWTQRSVEFVGPSEGDVQIFLLAPLRQQVTPFTQGTADFDKIELYEFLPGVYQTGWLTEDANGASSIPRYGRKEEIIHLDEYSEATSTAYRDTYWAEHAWPWPRPAGVKEYSNRAMLDVRCAGYGFTANWMYIMEGDGQAHDLDHWISAIVGADFGLSPRHARPTDTVVATAGDCQFLKTGIIRTNTLQVTETTGLEERPFDRIFELADLGDASGNPWRVWVDANRRVNYEQINTTPRYFIRRGQIYDTMSGNVPSNPWLMQPAVFRDMFYRGNSEPGSFLASPQDIYVSEVTMADGWDRPELTTELLSEAEILLRQAERGG